MVQEDVLYVMAQGGFNINNKTNRFMKKLLMISVLLLMGVLSMSGQTYCYKNEYKVSKDGVKVKKSLSYRYLTFTNNRSICYWSDKNGSAENYANTYRYVGYENNILHYHYENKVEGFGTGPFAMPTLTVSTGDLYVSSDYSRINTIDYSSFSDGYTYVYERATEPEKQKAPIQLY